MLLCPVSSDLETRWGPLLSPGLCSLWPWQREAWFLAKPSCLPWTRPFPLSVRAWAHQAITGVGRQVGWEDTCLAALHWGLRMASHCSSVAPRDPSSTGSPSTHNLLSAPGSAQTQEGSSEHRQPRPSGTFVELLGGCVRVSFRTLLTRVLILILPFAGSMSLGKRLSL